MFFADDDAVAVHTLAYAAREIYEKYCRKSGSGRMFDFVQAGNPGCLEKELWNLLNAARNFFKHEGASLDERIEFDDTMNDFAQLSACTTLCAPKQVEVQAFSIWFVAVEAPTRKPWRRPIRLMRMRAPPCNLKSTGSILTCGRRRARRRNVSAAAFLRTPWPAA
jgi:hypothetical protein